MYNRLKGFVLCGIIVSVLTVSSAYADINTGWYYGLGAGAAMATDSDFKSSDGISGSGDIEYDTGFLVSGAVGYKFGMQRLEAELLYQKNDLDKLNQVGATPNNVSGDINSLAFMINGYLDFANESRFTPFIMVGLGVANVGMDLTLQNGTRALDDDETVFAYQAGAGVAVDISKNFVLDLKYCYFGTGDQDFADLNTAGNFIENEFASHNITIGFRYNF